MDVPILSLPHTGGDAEKIFEEQIARKTLGPKYGRLTVQNYKKYANADKPTDQKLTTWLSLLFGKKAIDRKTAEAKKKSEPIVPVATKLRRLLQETRGGDQVSQPSLSKSESHKRPKPAKETSVIVNPAFVTVAPEAAGDAKPLLISVKRNSVEIRGRTQISGGIDYKTLDDASYAVDATQRGRLLFESIINDLPFGEMGLPGTSRSAFDSEIQESDCIGLQLEEPALQERRWDGVVGSCRSAN